jgi:hypothetical protein
MTIAPSQSRRPFSLLNFLDAPVANDDDDYSAEDYEEDWRARKPLDQPATEDRSDSSSDAKARPGADSVRDLPRERNC